MNYEERLIGSLSNQDTLESLVISHQHINNPQLLIDDYGWAGESIARILNHSAISKLIVDSPIYAIELLENTIHYTFASDQDPMHEGDKAVLSTLLMQQFKPVQRIHQAAKDNELDEFDDISTGAVKGIAAGAGVGYGLDIAGIGGLGGEILARAGPGMLEASGIAEELLGKESTGPMKRATQYLEDIAENHKNWLVRKGAKILSYGTSLTHDFKNIFARVVPNIYGVGKELVNIVTWLPRKGMHAAGFEPQLAMKIDSSIRSTPLGNQFMTYLSGSSEATKSNNERWAEAQENAPYRGLVGLAAVRTANDYFRLHSMPGFNIVMAAAESAAVFWINTGNNVQGTLEIINHYRRGEMDEDGTTIRDPMTLQDAVKETLRDPFQVANIMVCASWYATELTLRAQGFRPEEQLGQLGAGLESAALSMDTPVAGQCAKVVARYQLMHPVKKKLTYNNLYALCTTHGASEALRGYVEESKSNLATTVRRALNTAGQIAMYIPL